MPNRPSRIAIPIFTPSYDGYYYGRWPKGDKPATGAVLASDAQNRVAGSGALTTAIRLAIAAASQAAGSGGISTGIKLGAGASDVASASGAPTTGIKLAGAAADAATSSATLSSAADQADWLSRISDPGVIWYHNFDAAAEVDAFRWTGGYSGGNDPLAVGSAQAPNIAWVSSGGADGGGYLKITRPAGSGGDGTSWWRPFSPIVGAGNGRGVDDPGGSGAYGHLTPQSFIATDGGSQTWDWQTQSKPGWYGHASYSSSLFDGTDFYYQIRVKVDPRRTTSGNIQVGKLVSHSTTRNSYTNQEVVTYAADFAAPGSVGAPNYHNMYQGYNYASIEDVAASGGTINTTWAYSFGWDTLLYHVTPGRDGVSETRLEVWAAHEGESNYTKIWDVVYPAHFDGGTYFQNGWNALILWIYHNGQNNSEFWQAYDQVIFSKAFIPCPQPAPAWFVSQADSTWTTRSIGTWPTPSPTPATNLGGENVHSTMDAWAGACVDQRNGELLFVANGGHADYAGNEAYGILLTASNPQVYRISDPTPNGSMPTIGSNPPTNGDYGDGRPTATHNSNLTFGNGKAWLPYMTAAVSGQGGNVDQVWSFNRDLIGATKPWPYASTNPWTRHGSSTANVNFAGFGLSFWDETRNKIVAIGNGSGSAGFAWWKFSASGAYSPTSGNPGSPTIFPNWACYCKDLDCVVIGSNWDQKVWVWKLSDDSFTQLATSGTGYYGSATTGGSDTGSQYIAANHSIAVCDPRVHDGNIYKLVLPLTGSAINTGGTAVWTTLTRTGGPTPSDFFNSGRNNFTSSRFQIIRNMGNGQAALVYLPNTSGPLYVYKVPAAGL